MKLLTRERLIISKFVITMASGESSARLVSLNNSAYEFPAMKNSTNGLISSFSTRTDKGITMRYNLLF